MGCGKGRSLSFLVILFLCVIIGNITTVVMVIGETIGFRTVTCCSCGCGGLRLGSRLTVRVGGDGGRGSVQFPLLFRTEPSIIGGILSVVQSDRVVGCQGRAVWWGGSWGRRGSDRASL